MSINLDGSKPIFQQMAELITEAILTEAYPEESQIPSITEFSVSYNINPATALKGVNILVDEGLLYKKRGLGMFVANGARQKLTARRKEGFYQDFICPMLAEARRLALSENELANLIERGKVNHDY